MRENLWRGCACFMCQAAQQLSQDDLVLLLTAKKKKEQAVEDKKGEKEGQVTLEAGLCLCSAYSPPGHTQRSTFHLSIAPFFGQTVEDRVQLELLRCCTGDLRLHLPKVVCTLTCSSFTGNKPFGVLVWGAL